MNFGDTLRGIEQGWTKPRLSGWGRLVPIRALPLLVAILAGGCLSRPPLAKQSFSFPIPSMATNQAPSGKPVLEIRRVQVAAPFDSLSFIYRTGTYAYERDPYAEFLVPPGQALVEPLRGYLQDSHLFREVISQGDPQKADMVLEVYISELYGDFRNRAEPAAVLRMSFTFFNRGHVFPGQALLEKEYEQRVPFKTRTAAALMAAWNQALQRIMASLAADLKKSEQR